MVKRNLGLPEDGCIYDINGSSGKEEWTYYSGSDTLEFFNSTTREYKIVSDFKYIISDRRITSNSLSNRVYHECMNILLGDFVYVPSKSDWYDGLEDVAIHKDTLKRLVTHLN